MLKHMLIIRGLVAVICMQVSSSWAKDLSPDETFREAVRLYDEGSFKEAANLFGSLYTDGHINGDLLYNLGNALYRQGARGAASGAWLAAQELLPRDPDIRANLAFAMQQNQDKLESSRDITRSSPVLAWLRWFSLRELFLAFELAAILPILCAILSFFVKGARSALRVSAVLLGAASLLPAALCLILSGSGNSPGAVRVPVVRAYSAPGHGNTVLFEIHEGAPVWVESSLEDWRQIRLSDGKIGWISREDLAWYPIPQALTRNQHDS